MIRKGILALTISVLGTGSVFADEKPAAKPASSGIVNWFRNRSNANVDHAGKSAKPTVSTGKRKAGAPAVERAVVSDAERQAAAIRRTSGSLPDKSPATASPPTASMPAPLRPAPGTNSQAVVRQPAARRIVRPASAPSVAVMQTQSAPVQAQPYGQGYPQTGAALYPAPLPGIPQQVGGTAIVNPAFQPHEMLYPHQYKAMYGPYYYEVHGDWMVTPFGVWSQENWKLKGTEVDVKYKSHISPFSFFSAPVVR